MWEIAVPILLQILPASLYSKEKKQKAFVQWNFVKLVKLEFSQEF